MGAAYWSDDEYRERAAYLRRAGKGAFEFHDRNMQLRPDERSVHDKMNPFGVRFRESRDSPAHPESRAVAVLFDVTGSMRNVPRIVQENLCQLMDMLLLKRYLAHPQILVGGVGDATCDRALLQIGQFESGIEIDKDLAKLWLEGGGGGQQTESYELAMYFMARHTAIDCLEKRGQRGYLFLIGDEMPYDCVKREEVAAVLGEPLVEDIPVETMIHELESRYDTYFILPNLTSNYRDPAIHRCWAELLRDKVIRLDDPQGISDLIAAVIGLAEGVTDLRGIEADLRQTNRGHMVQTVCRAIDSMHGAPQRSYAVNAAMNRPNVVPSDASKKPRWDFGFSYNSRRWQFVMRIVRALAKPTR